MQAPNEKHLEDWIVNHQDKVVFPPVAEWDRGQPLFSSVIARQAVLPSGICDLIATDGDAGTSSICAIELKKGEIDTAAICQCLRYMRDIKDILAHLKMKRGAAAYEYHNYWHAEIVGIVIGSQCKDRNLLTAAAAADILVASYEYHASGDYTFTPLEPERSNYHPEIMQDYAYGSIGRAVKSVIEARIAHHKANPHG